MIVRRCVNRVGFLHIYFTQNVKCELFFFEISDFKFKVYCNRAQQILVVLHPGYAYKLNFLNTRPFAGKVNAHFKLQGSLHCQINRA